MSSNSFSKPTAKHLKVAKWTCKSTEFSKSLVVRKTSEVHSRTCAALLKK